MKHKEEISKTFNLLTKLSVGALMLSTSVGLCSAALNVVFEIASNPEMAKMADTLGDYAFATTLAAFVPAVFGLRHLQEERSLKT